MIFKEPLREGEFLKRYKRFFADVRLGQATTTAHVPNTGSLKTCLFPGSPCLVTESQNPARKLKATLHFLKTPTGWVGVDTSLPNRLASEAWENGVIGDWAEFKAARLEYKISKETRLDLVLAPTPAELEAKTGLHYVEIKNVTYAENGVALFPDAVTERGQKHLKELMALKRQGFGAELLFVVQRQDCDRFAPADAIDPEYGKLLRQARDAGVSLRALTCDFSPGAHEVNLSKTALTFAF